MVIYANFELNDILTMEIKMQGESTIEFYIKMICRIYVIISLIHILYKKHKYQNEMTIHFQLYILKFG